MKYIILEDFSGQPIPFLFPDRIDHGELREQLPYSTVLSAGYVYQTEQGYVCHGESKSLGAKAQEADAETIAQHFKEDQD